MMMFDMAVWKKTAKVIGQSVLSVVIFCILFLFIAAFCQQRVYRNTGLERNAYVEIFYYVLGGD